MTGLLDRHFVVFAIVSIATVCASRVPAVAAQARERVSLEWSAPEGAGCTDATELRRAVEARLGRAVFAPPSAATLHIRGTVTRRASPPGFRAVIEARQSEGGWIGRREVHADGDLCGTLDRSVVLVLWLTIDPDAPIDEAAGPGPSTGSGSSSSTDTHTDTDTETDTDTDTHTDTDTDTHTDTDTDTHTDTDTDTHTDTDTDTESGSGLSGSGSLSEPGTARGFGVTLGADLVGSVGLLPGPSLGGGIAFAVIPPGGVVLELAVRVLAPSRAEVAGTSAGAETLPVAIALSVCPVRIRASHAVSLEPTLSVDATIFASSGYGFDTNASAVDVASGISLALRAGFRVSSRVSVSARLGARLGFPRPRLVFGTPDGTTSTVWRSELASAELSLGVAFDIGRAPR